MTKEAQSAANFIKTKCLDKDYKLKPKVGIILGSGLGTLVDELTHKFVIPYQDIPNFPPCTVKGHGGNLHLGNLHNTPVACYEGRLHLYEGTTNNQMKTFVRTLKLIGCNTLLVTNAAGSLNLDVPTGHLVLIKDHINFQFRNPLIGPNDSEFGPRFVGMDDVYDITLRQELLKIASENNIPLVEGIFGGVLGPSFETHAEILMLKSLGVDVIAMSLIPEVIVARHCDMRVAAISAISNLAAGLHPEKLSHEVTLRGAKKASQYLITLINAFFANAVHI